jgi:hypothetical protein
VDIFRVEGGAKHRYVFHGPGNDYQVSGLPLAAALETADLPLTNVRQAPGGAPWQVTWTLRDGYTFTAFAAGGPGETVLLGDGWGQRDHRNTDRGAVLPYVVRTTQRPGPDRFVTVFAGAPRGQPLVTGVRLLELPPEAPRDAVAVEVATTVGVDVVVSMPAPKPLALLTSASEMVTDGRLAVVLSTGTTPTAACLVGGTKLSAGAASITCPAAGYSGRVSANRSEQGDSYFLLEGRLDGDQSPVGETLFVRDGEFTRAYPIHGIHRTQGQTMVYTKRDNVGFEARPGATWEYFPVSSWKRH